MGTVSQGRRRRRRVVPGLLFVAVVAIVAVMLVVAHRRTDGVANGASRTSTATTQTTSATARNPAFDEARRQLAALPVKGWDRESDFVRSRFGEPWSDDVNVEFGHNGCNTRDDILRRDLANLVVRPGTCYAQSGVLTTRTRARRSISYAGPRRRTPSRSTMSCRCRTPGTKAPVSGTTSVAGTSPTIHATYSRWALR